MCLLQKELVPKSFGGTHDSQGAVHMDVMYHPQRRRCSVPEASLMVALFLPHSSPRRVTILA